MGVQLKWVRKVAWLALVVAGGAQARTVDLGLLDSGGTFGQAVSAAHSESDHYTFSVGAGLPVGLSTSFFFDGGRIQGWSFSYLGDGHFALSILANRQDGVPAASDAAYQWQVQLPGGAHNSVAAIASAAPEPGDAAMAALGLTGVLLLVRRQKR